jgi:double-stranded uracil-DNA glycosylase
MQEINSFTPFAQADATHLILGSMPGVESLKQQQYYAYPHNCFWKIMGELFSFDYKISYEERIDHLLKNRIALWDTVQCCVRPGSLDSDIKNAKPNDFEKLFKDCPNITKVFFNGQTAHKLFIKHQKQMHLPQLELISLPSTSPANASISYQKKLEKWKVIKNLTSNIE